MRPEKSFALSFELIVTLALFFGLCLGAKAEETVKSEIKAEVVDKKPIVEDGIMAGIEDLVRRADLHAIFDKDFERQDIGGKAYWERRWSHHFVRVTRLSLMIMVCKFHFIRNFFNTLKEIGFLDPQLQV